MPYDRVRTRCLKLIWVLEIYGKPLKTDIYVTLYILCHIFMKCTWKVLELLKDNIQYGKLVFNFLDKTIFFHTKWMLESAWNRYRAILHGYEFDIAHKYLSIWYSFHSSGQLYIHGRKKSVWTRKAISFVIVSFLWLYKLCSHCIRCTSIVPFCLVLFIYPFLEFGR